MRFIWWNMQRLGRGTDTNRAFGMAAVLGLDTPEVSLLCELTTQCVDPLPLNYTYRAVTNGQLCYSVVAGTAAPNPPGIFTPGPATACYQQARFKGGDNFTRLTNRAPGLTVIAGVPVYFFHAPASKSRAKKAVSYLACFLNETHGNNPWILVGDLNIEPGDLEKAPVGINLADLIKEPDAPTFAVGLAGAKKYDYALSNIADLEVTVLNGSGYSDHEPILVTTG